MIDVATDTTTLDEPETAEAERRLANLPATWVTPELRSAALERASAAAFHRVAQERLDAAREAVQAAKEARDVAALAEATSQQNAAEQMVAALPPVPAVQVNIDAAALEVAQAAGRIPIVPTLAGALELEAWRSWPPHWQAVADPPVVLPAERALVTRIAEWSVEVGNVGHAMQYWAGDAAQTDSMTALEALAMLLPTVREIADRGLEIWNQAELLNRAREAGGISWDSAPGSIPHSAQIETPAIKALLTWRRKRQAEREAST